MSRQAAPLVALSFALMFGVTVWSAQNPAQTTNLYALDQTVSIEGVVRAFIFAGTHATIYLEPLEKTAAGSGKGGMRIVEWSPSSTPLSGQSINQQSVQNGDRVIVTGHPRRQLQDGLILLKTITRPADGWKWLDSSAKVDTLASTPKVSQQQSKPPVSPAASGGSASTAAGNNDPRLATLEPKVRQMVLEERDAAKVGCEGSVIPMNVYECDCYAREVFEDRLRIGTAVRVFGGDTFFVTAMNPGVPTGIGACVSSPKTEKYGKERASGLQLNPSSAVSECAGRELAVRFKKLPRPSPELIQPLLVEAMQFCRRGLQPGASTTPPSTAAAPPQTAIGAPANSTPNTSAQPGASPTAAPQTTASSAPPTPKPLGTPPPEKKVSPPPSADTLGERQAKIQSDVAERTKAVIEELRQKPQAGQPAAATPLGAPWQACGGTLRSTQSQTSVAVEFVNSSSEPRKLYWMDFGGMRKLYGTLRPGQRAPMQTYATHSWMVADNADRCLGTIVIAGPARLEIR